MRRSRMTRRHRLGALGVAVLVCAAVATGAPPVESDAAWSDAEQASGSIPAITVASPGDVRCAAAGLLTPAVVAWDPPAAGSNVLGYRWTLVGTSNRSGTLPADATSVSFAGGVLVIGTSRFDLWAVGPGGWEAPATNGASIGLLSVVVGLTTSCSLRPPAA